MADYSHRIESNETGYVRQATVFSNTMRCCCKRLNSVMDRDVGQMVPISRRRKTMRMEGEEIHVTEEEASGGSQPHIVRYVLAASLLLAIIAMSAIWMTGAATS